MMNKAFYSLLALLLIQIFILFSVLKGNDFENASASALKQDKYMDVGRPYIKSAHIIEEPEREAPDYPPFPNLSAHAYLVKLIGIETPLAAKREWKLMPPASLTKILTVLITLEELKQAEKVVFSADAKNIEDKRSLIRAGETLWRDDVVRLALISSSNDATMALAEKIGEKYGGETFEERIKIFIDIMNRRALLLGLKNSQFKNPSGLDMPGHEMSASDIARLAEYIWQNQRALLDITRIFESVIRPLGGQSIIIKNTNELLQEFPALRGGKTGLTDNAKGTLLLLYPVSPIRNNQPQKPFGRVSAGEVSNGVKSGNIAIIVILGSDDRFGDGRKVIQWLEKIAR